MTYVNQNVNKKFDWDDIDTGNFLLDHSQKFFARNNMKCEVYDDFEELVEENKENAISLLNALEYNNELKGAQPCKLEPTAHKIECENGDSIDNKVCDSNTEANQKDAAPLKSELPAGLQHLNIKDENDKSPGDNRNNDVTNAISLSDEVLSQIECIKSETENGTIAKTDADLANQLEARNVLLEWSTVVLTSKNKVTGPGGAAAVAPPRAYVFKDIYQQKREEKQRMLQNEERKLREFHSRPAPNFKELHKHNQIRPIVHQVTCPVTPATLKTWRATEEKVKKKREEFMRQQEVQRPKPRPIGYLQEQPFQPKHVAPTGLEQKPFRLHSDERVKQRREYNAVIQRAQEEKIKQEEEERKKREMDELKQIRKMTQFKARPNPFK